MLFIREIKYFDYMEAGFKIGHVGHAKIELWEKDGVLLDDAEEGEIHIKLSNLPGDFVGDAEIELLTTRNRFVIGKMQLSGDNGSFVCAQTKLLNEIDGNLAYNEIMAIRIGLGQKKEAFCKIHEMQQNMCQAEEVEEIAIEAVVEETAIEVATAEDDLLPDEKMICEQTEDTIVMHAAEEIVSQKRGGASETASMGEDKWSHLCNIYPRITPFSDDREYLQIGPGDFVLLSSKCYTLINNSFMLHGYYHYGQLVLCRVEKRGKTMYYLGTPGIYLEREKQVAIMYGFESFECASEPAAEGDFGYYMLQVEL